MSLLQAPHRHQAWQPVPSEGGDPAGDERRSFSGRVHLRASMPWADFRGGSLRRGTFIQGDWADTRGAVPCFGICRRSPRPFRRFFGRRLTVMAGRRPECPTRIVGGKVSADSLDRASTIPEVKASSGKKRRVRESNMGRGADDSFRAVRAKKTWRGRFLEAGGAREDGRKSSARACLSDHTSTSPMSARHVGDSLIQADFIGAPGVSLALGAPSLLSSHA